ncbi:UNVERIFIED_CONTAM: hypothetical protein HDU68_009184 [Siphonaria sp. JEL0065]|nr:hypothetical protein HDU68_009184 [Siphonaria sp. JEL0065]
MPDEEKTVETLQREYVRECIRYMGAPFILLDDGRRFRSSVFDLSKKAKQDHIAKILELYNVLAKTEIDSDFIEKLDFEMLMSSLVETNNALNANDWFAEGLISRDTNPITRLNSLFQWTVLNFESDLEEHYLRLEAVLPQFDIIMDNLKEGIARKVTMNRETVERLIKFCEKYAAQDARTSVLFNPPYGQEGDDYKFFDIPEEDADLVAGLVEKIFARVQEFADFLRRTYLSHARSHPGIYELPGYEQVLFKHSAKLYAGNSGLKSREDAINTFLRLVDDAHELTAKVTTTGLRDQETILDDYELVPESEEDTAPLFRYKLTPERFKSQRCLVLNAKKLFELPCHQWQAMILNDLYPGALHQYNCVMQDFVGTHKSKDTHFLRHFEYRSSSSHGWPHYIESIGSEIGFYDSTGQLFGRRERDLINSIMLVVDTGLHTRGWTIKQSVEFIRENAAYITEQDALEKVLECCENPGKALVPKMGERRIWKMREKYNMQYDLEKPNDLKEFHQIVVEREFWKGDTALDYGLETYFWRFVLSREIAKQARVRGAARDAGDDFKDDAEDDLKGQAGNDAEKEE